MKFIDLHCDTIFECWLQGLPLRRNKLHIDCEKLVKGGSLMQVFALFIPTHRAAKGMGIDLGPWELYSALYDKYRTEIAENKDILAPALCHDDIIRNADAGKISSMLSIEDGVVIGSDMELLRKVHEMGVRIITLTWCFENDLAYPSTMDPPEGGRIGLKPFGIEALEEMNRLGIIADVSHLSDDGFWDVAKYSKKPFIASHSCAISLCDHPRNLQDDMLKVLGEKGGVCGLNYYSGFLRDGADKGYTADIVRHARHIANVAGIDAVALGSDFDGIETPVEMGDYSGLPTLADALGKVFTPSELDKIFSKNALRVIKDVIG